MSIRITGNVGLLIRKARLAGTIEDLEQLLIDNHEYGDSGEHSVGRDIFILDAEKECPEIRVKSFAFDDMTKPPFFPQYPDNGKDPRLGVGGLNHWPAAEGKKWTFNS